MTDIYLKAGDYEVDGHSFTLSRDALRGEVATQSLLSVIDGKKTQNGDPIPHPVAVYIGIVEA